MGLLVLVLKGKFVEVIRKKVLVHGLNELEWDMREMMRMEMVKVRVAC